MVGIEFFKPGGSARARLGLAAAAWTAVGSGLLVAGLRWVVAGAGAAWPPVLVLALCAGWLKARWLLEPRAAANARRIVAAGDGRCLGGFFSWTSWAFVAAMIVLGAVLRRSAVPRIWLGIVYSAVGTALLVASRVAWTAWWGGRTGRGGPDSVRAGSAPGP